MCASIESDHFYRCTNIRIVEGILAVLGGRATDSEHRLGSTHGTAFMMQARAPIDPGSAISGMSALESSHANRLGGVHAL